MPLHIYEGLSGKLANTILKPGHRSKSLSVFSLLKRLIVYLGQHWPNTLMILRGDGHFCSKEFMDWSQNKNAIKLITGITANVSLNRQAETTKKSAEKQYERYGKPVKMYHRFEYKAQSWNHPQRVVVKVEVSSMGTNVRHIVKQL